MADETFTPDAVVFDPTTPVIASAPLSIGGQQASAVKVTSTLIGESDYTHDETLAGGYFIVNGQSVNSDGRPVNDKGQRINGSGKVMTPAEILADQYGQ